MRATLEHYNKYEFVRTFVDAIVKNNDWLTTEDCLKRCTFNDAFSKYILDGDTLVKRHQSESISIDEGVWASREYSYSSDRDDTSMQRRYPNLYKTCRVRAGECYELPLNKIVVKKDSLIKKVLWWTIIPLLCILYEIFNLPNNK